MAGGNLLGDEVPIIKLHVLSAGFNKRKQN